MQSIVLALHARNVDCMARVQTGNASGTDREGQGIDIDAIGLEDQRQIALAVRRAWKGQANTIEVLADDLLPQFETTINDHPEEISHDTILEEPVVIDQDRCALFVRQIRSEITTQVLEHQSWLGLQDGPRLGPREDRGDLEASARVDQNPRDLPYPGKCRV